MKLNSVTNFAKFNFRKNRYCEWFDMFSQSFLQKNNILRTPEVISDFPSVFVPVRAWGVLFYGRSCVCIICQDGLVPTVYTAVKMAFSHRTNITHTHTSVSARSCQNMSTLCFNFLFGVKSKENFYLKRNRENFSIFRSILLFF